MKIAKKNLKTAFFNVRFSLLVKIVTVCQKPTFLACRDKIIFDYLVRLLVTGEPASERIVGEEGYIHGAQDRVMEGKNQIRTIINNLECSVIPRPTVCRFGINPTDN